MAPRQKVDLVGKPKPFTKPGSQSMDPKDWDRLKQQAKQRVIESSNGRPAKPGSIPS